MAKKKKATRQKKTEVRMAAKRQARGKKPQRALKTAKPRRATGPRTQALPGMEEVRYKDLDRVCESIAETREEINRYKGEENDLEQKALMSMRLHERTTYTFSGVTLVRVPGEEKLRVLNARQRTASAETQPAADAGDGDAPDGLDTDLGDESAGEAVN